MSGCSTLQQVALCTVELTDLRKVSFPPASSVMWPSPLANMLPTEDYNVPGSAGRAPPNRLLRVKCRPAGGFLGVYDNREETAERREWDKRCRKPCCWSVSPRKQGETPETPLPKDFPGKRQRDKAALCSCEAGEEGNQRGPTPHAATSHIERPDAEGDKQSLRVWHEEEECGGKDREIEHGSPGNALIEVIAHEPDRAIASKFAFTPY